MARYDIYRNLGAFRDTVPYLVDVQSDHLHGLVTRIVIPLRLVSTFPKVKLPGDLAPALQIEGQACFLDTAQLAAVPVKELKKPVSSAAGYEDEIRGALDRLFGAY